MRKVLLQIGVIAAVLLVGVLAVVYVPNIVRNLRSPLLPPSGSETPGEEVPAPYGEEGLTEEVCRTAGGNWDSCGSACRGAPEGTVCIKVCVPYCECGGIAGFGCPEGFACGDYLPEGAADAMGVCKRQEAREPNIRVSAPVAGARLPNPFRVQGEARTFESHVALRVLDAEDNVLVQTFTTATAPDTGQFGPFDVEIYYPVAKTPNGFVEVYWNSPKDGAVLDLVRVPVVFESQRRTVKLFWSNSQLDPESTCEKVFAVSRVIPKTLTPARASLEELLRGPTEEETADSYSTSLPRGVQVRSLVVRNSIAYADFNEGLQNVGGSCRVTAIRAQIAETLKQFPTIRDVVISVYGNVEEALQP
jgi:hypothetical protein